MATAALSEQDLATKPDLNLLIRVMDEMGPGQIVAFEPVDWASYEHLLKHRDDTFRKGLRITYDQGRIEFMTVGYAHESYKSVLGRLITAICEVWSFKVKHGGNATVRRKDLQRGFEPDEWFYLGDISLQVRKILEKRKLDFSKDPAPSLVTEIDLSRKMTDRLLLYAAMGILEIWKFDGISLRILILQPNGTYQEEAKSRQFPLVPIDVAAQFVLRSKTEDDVELIVEFRELLRTLIAE